MFNYACCSNASDQRKSFRLTISNIFNSLMLFFLLINMSLIAVFKDLCYVIDSLIELLRCEDFNIFATHLSF